MLNAINFLLKKLLFLLPIKAAEIIRFEAVSLCGRLLSQPLRLQGDTPHYLNLGCGTNILDGFVNADFFTTRGIDFAADLRYPLRIADNSFDGIICEHTLEHLTYDEVARLLKECHRVLKPGGILRIAVPDLSIFIHHYCADDREWFARWEQLMFIGSTDPERAKRRLQTPMEALSFVTQEYGHVSSWDIETLSAYLGRSGFYSVTQRQFRKGACSELLYDLDSEDRKLVSLYVEAVK